MASPLHKWLFSPPVSPKHALPTHAPPPAPKPTAAAPSVSIFSSSVVNVESQRIPKKPLTRMSGLARAHSPLLAMKPIDIEAANAGAGAGGAGAGEYPVEKRSPVLGSPLLSPMFKAKVAHFVPRPVQRLLAVLAAFLFLATVSKYTGALFAGARHTPRLGERDYMPPQAAFRAPAHPRANRPDPHPLPATHELLALQSFILESSHATLSPHIDAGEPLDAVMLLGSAGARRLGGAGSAAERAWLQALADENARKVVLWYAGDRPPHYALEGVTARHGQGRRAATINTALRRDGAVIDGVLARLGHDLKRAPILVIAGEVFDASPARVHEMRESGQLHERLASMGWS